MAQVADSGGRSTWAPPSPSFTAISILGHADQPVHPAVPRFHASTITSACAARALLVRSRSSCALGYGLLVFGLMLGGFIPFFYLVRRIKFAENGVDYSLMNTTRQAPVPAGRSRPKYDGKTAIDTFFCRFGDLIQAVGVRPSGSTC